MPQNIHPPEAEVLVRVERVGKVFCRDFKKSLFYGFRDSMADLFRHRDLSQTSSMSGGHTERTLRAGEFWANHDISFELRRGECLGLIGHNGAGKTTLLKMLNGLIKPDVGQIEVRGKVGALIALGAGFNPLLTGRENIYVNGAVLGFSRSTIDEKMDEIIDFADIQEFIDSPVQSYSSGMRVRLGFAIAVMAEPDILILDEVLAVGDAEFRAKSLERVSALLKNCAVIFVSHQASQVARICDSALWLKSGRIFKSGRPHDLLEEYALTIPGDSNPTNRRTLAGKLEAECEKSARISHGDPFKFHLDLRPEKPIHLGSVLVGLQKAGGDLAAQARASWTQIEQTSPIRLSFSFENLQLSPGLYQVNVNVFEDPKYKIHLARMANCMTLHVTGSNWHSVSYMPKMEVDLVDPKSPPTRKSEHS
ncbi:MAG: ABC transporter ATP-binding protein [Verrucomicrobiales bacterium]